jgi:hypothetical protein
MTRADDEALAQALGQMQQIQKAYDPRMQMQDTPENRKWLGDRMAAATTQQVLATAAATVQQWAAANPISLAKPAPPAPPSPATVRLQQFIVDSLGELGRMYAELVLISPRWYAKLLPHRLPLGTAFGMFIGDADVVCVRLQPPRQGGNGNPALGPEAVYAIPRDIVEALVGEEVEKVFTD